MKTHRPGIHGQCLGCEKKLSEVHPRLKAWFYSRVLPSTPNAHVSCGYRGKLDQEACVKAGTSKLSWPSSAHNRRVAINEALPLDPANEADPNSKPESGAIDLFLVDGNGNALWPPKFFLDLYNECLYYGDPIKWGGKFKTLGDQDHFALSMDFLIP